MEAVVPYIVGQREWRI